MEAYPPTAQSQDLSFQTEQGKTIEIRPIGTPITTEDQQKVSPQSTVSNELKPPDQSTFSTDTSGPPKPPENQPPLDTNQSPEDAGDPSKPDTQNLETVDWESLSDEEKIEKMTQKLETLGMTPEQVENIRTILTEAQGAKINEISEGEQADQRPEKNKAPFSTREAAGVGMLFMLGAILDSRGTAHMLETFMGQYLKNKYIAPFMQKLGYDEKLLESLHGRRFDLGRSLFQMDRPSLLNLLSGLSKADAYDFLDDLDEKERETLIEEGTFGERHNILSKEEVKKYLLDRLTLEQKQKLRITESH